MLPPPSDSEADDMASWDAGTIHVSCIAWFNVPRFDWKCLQYLPIKGCISKVSPVYSTIAHSRFYSVNIVIFTTHELRDLQSAPREELHLLIRHHKLAPAHPYWIMLSTIDWRYLNRSMPASTRLWNNHIKWQHIHVFTNDSQFPH